MADRAINMPLRVTGIGEVERDFKRVGDAGSKNFAAIEKSANGAAREVSEYTARLKRAAAEANKRMVNTPELFKGSADQQRSNQRDFRLGFINAEKDRIHRGLPDLTRNYGQAEQAGAAFGMSLTRVTALSGAAGTAIYALGNFLMDSVGAFQDHERAVASFNAQMLLTGNRSNATAEDMQDMAKRIVESTGQTEKAALSAAAKLATVPAITREGLEAALQASAKFADSMGQDVTQTVEQTAAVFTALAEKDMQALIKALGDAPDALRGMIIELAAAGKTAEAQQVYIDNLNKSVGLQGLAKSVDRAGDSWNRFKTMIGEAISPAAAGALNGLSHVLDVWTGKVKDAKVEWLTYLAALANPVTAVPAIKAIAGRLTGGGEPDAGPIRIDLDEARRETARRDAQAAANARARAQAKALEERYGGSARRTGAGSGTPTRAALGDMVALIKQLFPGATITSTTRGKHEKGSDHYAGRAVDFVPGGGMGQFSTAQVEAMLKAAGVDIRRNAGGTQQLFGPGRSASKPGDHDDHFHVGFDGAPSPERAAAAAERAAAAAERQREEAVRRQRAFEQETAGLDAEILRARMAQVGDGAQLAALMQEQLKVEAEKYAVGLEARVQLGELSQAQADELKFKKAVALAMESQAVAAREQTRQIQEAFADQVAANDNQRDLLGAQESLADTVGERRQLALALLKLDQEEERLRLQTIIDQGKIADATAEQRKAAEQAQARLANLPLIEAAQTKGVLRQNQTSLERFIDDTDPKMIEDRANELVTDELMAVRSGVKSALASALGTDDPLITGLLEILLDQILFRPIAKILQNAQASGGGGFESLFGSLLGGIGGGGFNIAKDAAKTISANPSLFAAGTPSLPTGRPFDVGENGRERMLYHGNGRLEVISGPRVRRESSASGGNLTIIQNNIIPARADPRRTQSAIDRGNTRSMATAARKGLATPGSRR